MKAACVSRHVTSGDQQFWNNASKIKESQLYVCNIYLLNYFNTCHLAWLYMS